MKEIFQIVSVKPCSKCGKPRDRGPQRYCLACHAAHMRAHRPKYGELTLEQRLKDSCRSYAGVYARRGKITRRPCLVCGEPAEMHHPDYGKPLTVEWMCRKHHLQEHGLG